MKEVQPKDKVKDKIAALFLWHCQAREAQGLQFFPKTHLEALDEVFAELFALRKKLSRKGIAGRRKSTTPPKTAAERTAAHRLKQK